MSQNKTLADWWEEKYRPTGYVPQPAVPAPTNAEPARVESAATDPETPEALEEAVASECGGCTCSESEQNTEDADAEPSLFEKLGGEAAVGAAVDIFYRKVLADERINRFFEGVDMDKQAAKQKAFLTMAFGGPHNYTGLDMRNGHAHLVEQGLDDTHFDAVVENLGATLTELNVADDLIAQVAAIAETTRNDVLGK